MHIICWPARNVKWSLWERARRKTKYSRAYPRLLCALTTLSLSFHSPAASLKRAHRENQHKIIDNDKFWNKRTYRLQLVGAVVNAVWSIWFEFAQKNELDDSELVSDWNEMNLNILIYPLCVQPKILSIRVWTPPNVTLWQSTHCLTDVGIAQIKWK